MSEERSTDHPLERLVFFSDAVFAIAITLLIIEVEIPDLPRGSTSAQYLDEIGHLLPHFFGFFMSFGVIAAFWITHHRAFAMARRYSHRMLAWNMPLLAMIALTPWVTGFLSSNLNEIVPTAVYFGAFTITGLLNARLAYVATEAAASDPDTAPAARLIRRRCIGLAAGAATALALCFVLPESMRFMGLITVGFWIRFLTRGQR
jgi:uncharacterized membrane protein